MWSRNSVAILISIQGKKQKVLGQPVRLVMLFPWGASNHKQFSTRLDKNEKVHEACASITIPSKSCLDRVHHPFVTVVQAYCHDFMSSSCSPVERASQTLDTLLHPKNPVPRQKSACASAPKELRRRQSADECWSRTTQERNLKDST